MSSRRAVMGWLFGGAAVTFSAAVTRGAYAQDVAPSGPAVAETAPAAPSTPAPASLPECPAEDGQSMRDTLKYVELSPHGAERDCRNCEFWIAEETGAACGGCTLIPGPISPIAYCDVWAPIA